MAFLGMSQKLETINEPAINQYFCLERVTIKSKRNHKLGKKYVSNYLAYHGHRATFYKSRQKDKRIEELAKYDQTLHRKGNIISNIPKKYNYLFIEKIYNKAYTEKCLFPCKISKDKKV